MKHALQCSSIALACVASLVSLAASAGMIAKNSGSTTPNMSDFAPAFANHPNKVGYNHPASNGMFIETFRTPCEKGMQPSAALFTIKVKKLSVGRGGGDNDALAFWDAHMPVFNTYLWQASDPAGAIKTLSINLATLPAVGNGVINSPNNNQGGSGLSLLADGDFSFSVQDDTSVLEASIEYACKPGVDPNKKGMTWGVYPHDPVTGAANVSCQGSPNSPIQSGACDPYNGDTPASAVLPVLCFNPLKLPNPVPSLNPPSDPGYWSGGVIATTAAKSPATEGWTHLSHVDAYCAAQFGPGWVVADFHRGQGKGWKFGAYGNVGKPGIERFWVNIKDKPNGNVWAQ